MAPLPLGFTRIDEGDAITLGQRRWQVRFGQGHAPDHATLWSLDDDLILGGDQLLPGISPNIGVYATEPEADPLAEWIAACHAFQPDGARRSPRPARPQAALHRPAAAPATR